jgi:hypothetical protein
VKQVRGDRKPCDIFDLSSMHRECRLVREIPK